MNEVKVPTLEELTEAIKQEVLQLMRAGAIPVSVRTFSELHDHCDANCLGGLCKNEVFDAIWRSFAPIDTPTGMPDGMVNLINGAQDAVNAWLASGEAQAALDSGSAH
jgi:DNA-binding transcriptional ArsR family regulator